MDKVADAIELIRYTADNSVVMSSFGKDSMVLLDLVKRAGFKLPVLFFKEPFFPEKYAYANKVILQEGYAVYDYAPSKTGVLKKNGNTEIANFYQIGEEFLFLPTGVIEPLPNHPFLCGFRDLLSKPTGSFKFPWKTMYVGHKSSDVDPLQGPVPLSTSVLRVGIGKLVFPLRYFTDEDIWAYHKERNIPAHDTRYRDGKELEDKTFNPDYFPACTRCLDRDREDEVMCPLLRRKVKNVAAEYEVELPPLEYMGK